MKKMYSGQIALAVAVILSAIRHTDYGWDFFVLVALFVIFTGVNFYLEAKE